MTSLDRHIRDRIRKDGPMDIETFMSLALCHPEHGYYTGRDPLGVSGDFTTAPEISQMFGEMIGVWLADAWSAMNRPERFTLLECGPGRGTLMADALRATKHVDAFQIALSLHLLEVSPVLKEKQSELLDAYNPQWHDTLETLPGDRPLFVVANEFLDALPIRQAVMTKDGWKEHRIDVDEKDRIHFTAGELLQLDRIAPEGTIYEYAPAREAFVRALSIRIKKQGGAVLCIDYGYDKPGFGDTLQAIKNHEYAPVFSDIGQLDLTAHVDFGALKRVTEEEGLNVDGPRGQGDFLRNMGIETRAELLKLNAGKEQQKDIDRALHRLTAEEEMGDLFRVIALQE